jgi:Cu(I)/Ag(I) efflux system membrane protein CusA/SilA
MTVMLSVAYAMTGGLFLQWLFGYSFSVAVWVGYITLYGMAVQTGVIMVLYLDEALDRELSAGSQPTEEILFTATIAGAVLRLRPKLMTVIVTVASLLPVLWSSGVGADIMKPIAVPIVGGMVTSAIHVLIITPIIFFLVKRRALESGLLKAASRDNVSAASDGHLIR